MNSVLWQSLNVSPRSFERIVTALSSGSLKRFLDHEGGTPRKCDTPLRQLTFLRMSHLFCSQQIPVPSVVTKSDGTPGCLAFHPPEFQAKKASLVYTRHSYLITAAQAN